MGTNFHVDQVLDAFDGGRMIGKRQLELFTPSGTMELQLRIGELDEEQGGRGYCVGLTPQAAAALLEGLERGIGYVGMKPE